MKETQMLYGKLAKKQFLIFLFSMISCVGFTQDIPCDELKYGVYEIYENNEKVGVIYRKDNLQLEDYLDGKELSPTKIREKDCYFYINSFEIKEAIDTVTMVVEYEKIKKNYYTFLATPKYLDLDYEYKGEIKKVGSDIEPDILEIFESLEKVANKNPKFK